MKSLIRVLTFCSVLFGSASALADKTPEQPLSFKRSGGIAQTQSLHFAPLEMRRIEREDEQTDGTVAPYRFAINHVEKTTGEFTAKGEWFDEGKTQVWRLPVSADGAQSLSFGFDDVFLPAGTRLFVYDESHQQVLGPYTDRDNKSHGQLWTPIIEGDTAFIEINVPSKMKPYLRFNIHSVNHGYRSTKATAGQKSGSCNIDVVCPQGDAWRDEIRSVASYSFSTGGSSFVCTGSLVNNATGDLTPYFLTANHCVSTVAEVQSMVLFWNFETSVCDGTPDGSRAQSQSGATLRATWGGGGGPIALGDVTLVELDSTPSAAFNVHWAGWDASTAPPTSSVAIHHPSGDEKRISFDFEPATVTEFLEDNPSPNGNQLRIASWNEGTTEPGSSGSGLWNDQRRIVGTLSGGFASCSSDSPDWYGRFASQWEGGGTPASQLKAWLDPANTGIIAIDGTDACTAPNPLFAINPNPAEVGQPVSFTSTVTGDTSGLTYAWDFDGDDVIDSTQASPTFTYGSSFVGNVALTVTNSGGCDAETSAAIVVNNQGGNQPPVAVVAQNTITTDENSVVQLDASQSTDSNGDALTYAWVQTNGTAVVLSDSASATPTFTAPPVTATTSLSFEVTVTDPFSASDSATVNVTVNNVNAAPMAVVTPSAINVNEGGAVSLNASASSDADGDTLSFAWTQTAGTTVTLAGADSATATFTAPEVSATASLTFEVTVTDPSGAQDTATVSVTVSDVPPVNPPSSGGGGGGALGWPLLSLSLLAACTRRRKTSIHSGRQA